jgi:hypothetical protein
MSTTILNLTDLDNLIRSLEQKYGITTLDMLKDASARCKISEDVLLRWEAYVRQRVRLRDADAEVRGSYLARLHSRSRKFPTPGDQVILAA